MPTTYLKYFNESLFVGPSPSTGYMFSSGTSGTNFLNQIYRVQSANRNISINRQDVNQLGQTARIDSIITEPPTVGLDFSYLLTNILNESGLGLTVNSEANTLSGIMDGTTDDRNYFIARSPQGVDDINFAGASRQSYGFGNGFISSYSAEGAVGGLATASVSVECFNFRAYNAASGVSPAIIPTSGVPVNGPTFELPVAVTGVANQAVAIRYGEITVDLSQARPLGASVSDLKVQNFNLNLPIARENINQLGSLYPYAKTVQLPVTATLSVNAIVGDLATGALSDIFCNDDKFNITITLYKPGCPGDVQNVAIRYIMKGAKLTNQTQDMTIGPNQAIDMNFDCQLGAGNDSLNGIFISGSNP